MPKRPDAEILKTSKFREFEFHMMHGRNESALYYETPVDLTETLKFREKYNKSRDERDKITLFEIYLAAMVRTVALRYKVNRFVSGRRLWQRNQIIFSFVVKKEKTEDGEEITAQIEFDPFDNLEAVHQRVYRHIYEARYGENDTEKEMNFYGALPRWFIRLLFWFIRWMDEHNHPIYSLTQDIPLWATAFVAQLGSLGIKSAYHHLFDLGTCSFFLTFGNMHKAQIMNQETGVPGIKNIMNIKISLDDRISEGAYTGPTVAMAVDLMENPEKLLEKPELTDEQLDKLMLKKYKIERLEREKARKKKMKAERKKKK